MPKKSQTEPSLPPSPAVLTQFSPSPGSLTALVALGAGSALWALLLWGELVASRLGGSAVCALGDASQCAAVWDSAFASWVHRVSGVPVAGWGLVWGLVAFGLPLFALLRVAEARPMPALVSAIRLTAAAGGLSVLGLIALSAAGGALCLGCAGTYVLVAGYAGIALFGWPTAGLPEAERGAVFAGTATLTAFLLLLYPGIQTPRAPGEAGQKALAAAVEGFATGSGTGDATRDQQLERLVSSLAPEMKQRLADSLLIYRQSPQLQAPTPRRLDGHPDTAVLITEWTDVLCGHCADLHRTLMTLRESLPHDSFAVDARQFPLDGDCNPLVQRSQNPLRCLAARVQICLEGHQEENQFLGELFESQDGLTSDRLFAVASTYMARANLEACVASPDTSRKLREDIEAAARYQPDGTPLVVVNGRRGTSFGPFLYAMTLTGGNVAHPAFAGLPAPNPEAHIH